MKEEKSKTSYEIVFESLLNEGYSEKEAEILLCEVIDEQRKLTKLADQIDQILKNSRTNHFLFKEVIE